MSNKNVVIGKLVNSNLKEQSSKSYAFWFFGNYHGSNYVLVDTQYGAQILKVVEFLTTDDYKENHKVNITRDVICELDFDGFNKRNEIKKRKAEIIKDLDRKIKEDNQMMMYQIASKNNPEIKKLYDELMLINSED